jgi:hypothetical protein
MGELVTAIQQSSSNSHTSPDNDNGDKEEHLSLSSTEQIEIITQTNTKRNSVCCEGERHSSTLATVRRLSRLSQSVELVGLGAIARHRVTQENINRRTLRWNPTVA